MRSALSGKPPPDSWPSCRAPNSTRGKLFATAFCVFTHEQRLVLTGAPDGGKSAFVNFVALCLAGEMLGDGHRDLKALTEPLPEEDGTSGAQSQHWDHGPLVPLRIILRDFAVSSHFPKVDEEGETKHIIDFIRADLENKGFSGYYPVLEQRLRRYGGLVMLDGLDEVSKAGERRERLIHCISAFSKTFDKVRLLVTCRPYAYEQDEWRRRGFKAAALANFGPGQIRRFIDRWYAGRPEYDRARAQERADKLKREVLGRPALRELAERPLLLTLTAYLHGYGHELPDRRADLYEALLGLLIDKWEAARFRTEDAKRARELEQYSLAEFLRVGRDDVQRVLERLAFRAHEEQEGLEGSADIPVHRLTHELLCLARHEVGSPDSPVDALAVSEYLRDRVGVLYQRGGSSERDAVYSFPHRSFQEYLVAAYLRREEQEMYERFADADCFEWPELAAHLGRSDPDRWREVVLLAGGIKASKEPGPVWRLVDALFPGAEDAEELVSSDAWGLRLAAEILAESLERQRLNRRQQPIHDRVRDNLPRLLRSDHLPASERVAAGLHLAIVGDPRPEVTGVDAMEFCRVPAGRFFLGAMDKSAYGAGDHELDYEYWLARYPVTVAQFRQFVKDREDFEPDNPDSLGGSDNTPVVYVSWNEAVAFCDWLTARWQQQGWLREGWGVGLPSEPEWEKAAKGGYRIPAEGAKLIRPIAEISALTESPVTLVENPDPRRPYPWGEAADPERMNIEWNIGRVSPAGAYPQGRSPYGCEELSGNVWELARRAPKAAARVLRGGAFRYGQRYARCASRRGSNPDVRDDDIGFRVVLSPLL